MLKDLAISIYPQLLHSQLNATLLCFQRVLKDLVKEKLPAIHAQLETHQVDLSLFTFNWFLTVFVDNIPTETFLRIWDSFLYEGSKVSMIYSVVARYVEFSIMTNFGCHSKSAYIYKCMFKVINYDPTL